MGYYFIHSGILTLSDFKIKLCSLIYKLMLDQAGTGVRENSLQGAVSAAIK
jgi:hypothetical protein